MKVLAIIIYVILALFLGPLWPIEMFAKGGCLGQIIAGAWWCLLLAGIGVF